MAFTPAQPDQSSPTWGQAYGLLSFQITGVLVGSAMSYLFKIEAEILSSVVVTILFSALYARLAETKVPGALSQRRLRLGIAFRASFLLALLSLVAVGIYDGPRLIESGRIGVRAFLIAVGLLLYFLTIWLGLELGAWYTRRQRLKGASA